MEIVGLILVRNEERFLDRVLDNMSALCDRAILLDHGSGDATPSILRVQAARRPGWEYHAIADPSESHAYVSGLAGSDAWVFGVDGDEIYDPFGLALLRERIFAGELDPYWRIVGNVLHCDRLDPDTGVASGFLAPPCKSMTKLYNFRAIRSWQGAPRQRLHHGTIEYRPGYGNGSRKLFKEECSWESSPFRCLHACFVPRSGLDPSRGGGRLNISERHWPRRVPRWIAALWRRLGLPERSWYKNRVYRRGPRHTFRVPEFFPAPPALR